MPVPDQVRDDRFGIQNPLNLLDSGYLIESGTSLAGMTVTRKRCSTIFFSFITLAILNFARCSEIRIRYRLDNTF